MNRFSRLCVPLALSFIVFALTSPVLADEACDDDVATVTRNMALRYYRANYAALRGVQCKITRTITTNIDAIDRQNATSVNNVDSQVINAAALGDDNEGASDAPVLRKKAHPIGSSKSVVDAPSGDSARTSEHRVYFCGPKVRSECYVEDTVESRYIRNCFEYSYESTTAISAFGTPLIRRATIDDPLTRSGPIIDPRDFGASSGIGRLEEMLATWDAISAYDCPTKCGRSELFKIKLREPIAAREHADQINECVLYLDPKMKLLPVVAEHFQQGDLSQVVEITYAKCDWLPNTCYLATEAVYAMPADPRKADYSSAAEIVAHSRQRFVVTEAAPFEPTDNDKTFRLRSPYSAGPEELESTLISAPPEERTTADRIVDASRTLPLFLGALLVVAAASIGIVLRQQVSVR